MRTEADPWWTVLVGVLESFALVSDREPEGLIISAQRADGIPIVVEVVMTPEEWDDLVSISWGVVETAAQHVGRLVLDRPPGKSYLVYNQYQLVACNTPQLPVDPGLDRLRRLAAQHPDGIIPGGGWYAHEPDDV